MKTFFIVDDHALLKRGVSELVEKSGKWKCSGSASSFDEAVSKLKTMQSPELFPNVIIVDVNIEGEKNGFALVKEILNFQKDAKCLVYSMYTSAGIIAQSFECGATGFISKSASEKEFLFALLTVADGSRYIEQSLVSSFIAYGNILASLTKRERQVLDLTLQNKSNDEIAESLGIQKRAIENYISRIYTKVGCKSHLELENMFLK